MPTRNVHLTEHFDRLIAAGVESGEFNDASEVIREGLRLLEQRQQEDRAKIDWLRGATRHAFAAFDRGEGIPLASAGDIDALVDVAIEEGRAVRRSIRA